MFFVTLTAFSVNRKMHARRLIALGPEARNPTAQVKAFSSDGMSQTCEVTFIRKPAIGNRKVTFD
jgi:hypothetical protein